MIELIELHLIIDHTLVRETLRPPDEIAIPDFGRLKRKIKRGVGPRMVASLLPNLQRRHLIISLRARRPQQLTIRHLYNLRMIRVRVLGIRQLGLHRLLSIEFVIRLILPKLLRPPLIIDPLQLQKPGALIERGVLGLALIFEGRHRLRHVVVVEYAVPGKCFQIVLADFEGHCVVCVDAADCRQALRSIDGTFLI